MPTREHDQQAMRDATAEEPAPPVERRWAIGARVVSMEDGALVIVPDDDEDTEREWLCPGVSMEEDRELARALDALATLELIRAELVKHRDRLANMATIGYRPAIAHRMTMEYRTVALTAISEILEAAP